MSEIIVVEEIAESAARGVTVGTETIETVAAEIAGTETTGADIAAVTGPGTVVVVIVTGLDLRDAAWRHRHIVQHPDSTISASARMPNMQRQRRERLKPRHT